MSTIQASIQRALDQKKTIVPRAIASLDAQNGFIEIKGIHMKKNTLVNSFGVSRLEYYPPTTNVPSSALTTQTQFDIQIKANPVLYLKSNKHMYLSIPMINTDASHTITPTWAESMLLDTQAVEYLIDGKSFLICPCGQVLIEPMTDMLQSDYVLYSNVTGKNASTMSTTPTLTLANSGTAIYFLRLPNPFPAYGFWLGALANKTLTVRIRTQIGGGVFAVQSGGSTSSLQVGTFSGGMAIWLDCQRIPENEIPILDHQWRHMEWNITNWIYNNAQPNQVLPSTGITPKFQLQNFANYNLYAIFTIIHNSRNFTSNAFWQALPLVGAPNNGTTSYTPSQSWVTDQNGNQIFTSSQEYFALQEFLRALWDFPGRNALQTLGLIYQSITFSFDKRHQTGLNEGTYNFTGNEYMNFQDVGTVAANGGTAVYVDSWGLANQLMRIDDGTFNIVQN